MQHIKDSNSGNSRCSKFVPTFMQPKKYTNNQLALSATTTASMPPYFPPHGSTFSGARNII
jgi:hypothetical protein